MQKKMVKTFLIMVLVFGLIFGFYGFKQMMIKKYLSNFGKDVKVISTVIAKSQTWQPYLYAVGSLSATSGVDISPETDGQVSLIYFKDGQTVKAGDPLIQQDDSAEKAQLETALAQLHLAQLTLTRTQSLMRQKATTQESLDTASSNVRQFSGNVDNIRSAIAKKLLRAPFSGKIGIKQVNVGQYVKAGAVCASLQAVKALNVQFPIAQQDLQKVFLRQKVSLDVDAYPGQAFEGFINAINSKVDDNTRTIQIQATVDNSQSKLLPGMYTNVQVFLTPIPNQIVLPQTAIVYSSYGDSVFVVTLNGKEDNNHFPLGEVKRSLVEVGDKQGSLAVIKSGIKEGDTIVNAGQSKLDEETPVAINNAIPL